MKKLFGRVYFFSPCFVGIQLNSKVAVVVANTLLVVAISSLVVYAVS